MVGPAPEVLAVPARVHAADIAQHQLFAGIVAVGESRRRRGAGVYDQIPAGSIGEGAQCRGARVLHLGHPVVVAQSVPLPSVLRLRIFCPAVGFSDRAQNGCDVYQIVDGGILGGRLGPGEESCELEIVVQGSDVQTPRALR